jgi:DNA-binding NtrC family response regulator
MKPAETTWTILVVDRNPNVRQYLKRELAWVGYRVLLAENCRSVVRMVQDKTIFDLVILDPDLPDEGSASLLQTLRQERPGTPIIIHSLVTDTIGHESVTNNTDFVEKDGRSIEHLKQVVAHRLA